MAKTKFEVYKDNKGNYRWRLLAQNGEPVASSGEGFKEKRTAMNAVKKLKEWANTETILDLEKMKEDAIKQKEKDAKAKTANKTVAKALTKKTVAKPAPKKVAAKPAVKKANTKPAAPAKKTVAKPVQAKEVIKEVVISKTVI